MRRVLRVSLAGLYTVFGGIWILLAVLLECRREAVPPHGLGRRAQRAWCRGLCRLLGLRLDVEGERPIAGPVLLVANHVSWLDIVCLASLWPVSFLSKSEVSRWPVIGRTATALGTLYIARGRPAAAEHAVEAMQRRLRAGGRVLFFPEGTTSDGCHAGAFRARLFQAAIDAGAPVQAVALRYLDTDDCRLDSVPFIGEQSLVANLWRIAAQPVIYVNLTVGPARSSVGARRSELAQRTRADVEAALSSNSILDDERAAALG